MQDQRDSEAEGELQGQRGDQQKRGPPHCLPEHRVGQNRPVILQADELALTQPREIEELQRGPDRVKKRRDSDQREHDDGGAYEAKYRAP